MRQARQLLLIDGHSVIFRSYFAFARSPLRNAKGMNTSAVFGFANTLRKLLDEFVPEHCAVVYDAPGRTFRHEQYEAYKVQRPPMPEELTEQVPVIKEMVAAMGLPALEVPGVEADDVIGTLAKRFAARGFEVVIVSTDKDMFQLVGGTVSVYDPWKGTRYRAEEVREKLGVGPERVVDYLAMVGDATDNVPGVRGVGPKRAREILDRYDSLDEAARHEPRLRDAQDALRLSRSLVSIDTGVEVDADAERLATGVPDTDRLRRIYEEMGFRTLLAGLEPEEATPVEVTGYVPGAGENAERVAFSYEPGKGLWLTTDGERTQFIGAGCGRHIREVVGSESALKVGIDVKGQVKALRAEGYAVGGPVFDVSVAGWLVDPNVGRYGIEDLSVQLHGRPTRDPGPAGRPAWLYRLAGEFETRLAAMGLEPLARDIEMPLVFVLARMEERGIGVDRRFLADFGRELDREVEAVQRRIRELAGSEFNVSSPRQLGKVLFEDLGLRRGRKMKTGYSTSSNVLAGLVDEHPVVAEVLRYRELTKLAGTYVRPLLELAEGPGGRVHADFNQTGTATGRLSSSNPNIQNIPIRTDIGRRIRKAFVAGPGNVLISADYSQIELRVLAHISGDERLRAAFEQGEDIHVRTAAEVFGIEPSAVTPAYRRLAKVVNYGIIYGMGDFGLSSRMDIPLDQARSFLDGYLARFDRVARWREELVEQACRDGFVRTLAGRLRPVPGVLARNRNVAEAAKRAALNAPIQGSAADVIKRAMLRVEPALAGAGIGGGMLVQVHDELLFEVPRRQAGVARDVIKEEMEGAWRLDVPLVVDIGSGSNWEEAH